MMLIVRGSGPVNRDRRLLLNVGCHKLTINDVKIFRNLEFSRLCMTSTRLYIQASQIYDSANTRLGLAPWWHL